MAVFGIPLAHEDDALRRVRAVAEIRERLTALGDELAVALSFRTGVNTGEVVAGEGETLVTGDAVNVAARLEQAATPGEILIGAETLSLVRDAVTVERSSLSSWRGSASAFPRSAFSPSMRPRKPSRATSTRRSSAASGSSSASARRSRTPSRSGSATCSRCSDRRGSGSPG